VADIVFVTGMLVQKESVHQVSDDVSNMESALSLAAIRHHHHRRPPTVDHIFLGEAETTLPQFIEDWNAARQSERIRQLNGRLWQRRRWLISTWWT